MLRQIDATLKQEKSYLEKFNKQLKDKSITETTRAKVIIFRKACLEAITRHEKAKLQYI